MKDFSQLLLDNVDTIVDNWITAVRQDEQIESARHLPHKAVLDNLPRVLRAMVTILSQTQDSDLQTLVQATIQHGVVRAEQGYDATEIAREYRIVRWVIFSTLEAELLAASPLEVIRASRIIDTVIDESIAFCFKAYTNERLQELHQLQTELQLTNQELSRLVRESQENFSDLAHNLQTPLNSIIAYINLFLQKNSAIKDNCQDLHHIQQVLRKSRQFLHLLNDTVEFCRFESGKLQLQLAATDIKELIKGVQETIEPLVNAKNLQLVIECDRAPDQVLTDPLKLYQIFSNLLNNSLFNTESGQIKLICQLSSDSEWSIIVTDTGSGFAPEDQEKIFEPQFRFIASSQSLPSITGLAMAIVYRFVKLLQGRIELTSQISLGSTFTVTFPLQINQEQKYLIPTNLF